MTTTAPQGPQVRGDWMQRRRGRKASRQGAKARWWRGSNPIGGNFLLADRSFGGYLHAVMSDVTQILSRIQAGDQLALDEALTKLATRDPRKAELVQLRFFAGLSIKQAAQVLGIAESTAYLDWTYAKTWLRVEMAAEV